MNEVNTVPTSVPVPNEEPSREFTAGETVLAWLSLFGGYLFWRVCPVHENPLGGFLFLLVLLIGSAVLLVCRGKKPHGLPLCALISGIFSACSLFVCDNGGIHTLSFLFGLACCAYFLYGTAGKTLEPGFSDLLPMDIVKAVFCLPFLSFGAAITAVGGRGRGKAGAVVGKILLGLCIAFIPTGIVLLLLSYDSGFTDLLSRIFVFEWDTLLSHLASVLFGIPVGMYLYGLYISALDGKADRVLSAERCHAAAGKARVIPMLTGAAAVAPILFLYIVFFISQWEYYVAAFFHRLPASDAVSVTGSFSVYSEYAREGFFQLCAVSALNLVILSVCALFAKRDKTLSRTVLKIINIAYSLSTLILIATALAKMKLYIDRLGLTPLRVYATWFMLILAVIFLLILIKQFFPKLPLLALSVCLAAVFYCVPVLFNVDARIADYNVGRYLAGTLDSVDFEAMEELGDSAVPALARLARELDEKNGTDIFVGAPDYPEYTPYYRSEAGLSQYDQLKWYLWEQSWRLFSEEDISFFSFTLPRARARKALTEIGLAAPQIPDTETETRNIE